MGDSVKRVLFVNSEIFPYLPESGISLIGRYLPQGIQERKKEIRSFMPRFGCINERKNQLHEVIRLSGMNIIINDVDRPLVIKVASISAARMQVYFIDNEDYFHRKQVYRDDEGKFFSDNGLTPHVRSLGIDDKFVEHGTVAQLQAICGYDADGIERTIKEML